MSLFEDSELAGPGPSAPRTRVRLTVAYHGAGFHGMATQPEMRTVGGVLSEALARLVREPVDLAVAGRTDAGVHAWGQVVSFDVPVDTDLEGLARRVNRMLAPEIVVRDCQAAGEGFDARRSAVLRRYRYTVLNRPVPDPFLASTSWWVPERLDVRAMQLACDPLIGEHDFASFCRKPPDPEASLVRVVHEAEWVDEGEDVLCFWVGAGSFCQQMVRSLVGTIVDMGLGRLRAGEMTTILRARDRRRAGRVAPPQGLCLWEVRY